jgi:dienelactone hydrolase
MTPPSRVLVLVTFTLSTLLAACGSSTSDSGVDGAGGMGGSGGTGGETPATYRELGPFAAGVTTLELADRQVEVWYPSDPATVEGLEPYSYFIRDYLSDLLQGLLEDDVNPPFVSDAYWQVAPSTEGPFPLVVFAHGASSYRNQSAFLTAHLASWGFVVASVDYLERGLPSFLGPTPDPPIGEVELTRSVVTLLTDENQREGALLEGKVATDRIAITGHSAGGGTSIRFANEPDVITYIPLSAGISSERPTELADKPSLWLTGTTDGIVAPERTIDAYNAAPSPARLVLIEDMGHLGPSDICTIGDSGGGVIAIALEAGLPIPDNLVRLGTDGCAEDDVIQEGWPIVRHFVTSQLRWAFGFDEEPVGLSQEVQSAFPEATFEYDESL